MNAQTVIQKWFVRVHRMQIAHYDAATHFEKQNLRFGIPVVVLSTVVGTTIFSTISKTVWIPGQVFAGLMSVAAGVLASLQTFLRYGERAERHRIVGAKYAGLKTELELILTLPPKDPEALRETLESFRARWGAVHEEAPTVPQSIFDRAMTKVKVTVTESTSSDEEPPG